jgi:hypothetical protein
MAIEIDPQCIEFVRRQLVATAVHAVPSLTRTGYSGNSGRSWLINAALHHQWRTSSGTLSLSSLPGQAAEVTQPEIDLARRHRAPATDLADQVAPQSGRWSWRCCPVPVGAKPDQLR